MWILLPKTKTKKQRQTARVSSKERKGRPEQWSTHDISDGMLGQPHGLQGAGGTAPLLAAVSAAQARQGGRGWELRGACSSRAALVLAAMLAL